MILRCEEVSYDAFQNVAHSLGYSVQVQYGDNLDSFVSENDTFLFSNHKWGRHKNVIKVGYRHPFVQDILDLIQNHHCPVIQKALKTKMEESPLRRLVLKNCDQVSEPGQFECDLPSNRFPLLADRVRFDEENGVAYYITGQGEYIRSGGAEVSQTLDYMDYLITCTAQRFESSADGAYFFWGDPDKLLENGAFGALAPNPFRSNVMFRDIKLAVGEHESAQREYEQRRARGFKLLENLQERIQQGEDIWFKVDLSDSYEGPDYYQIGKNTVTFFEGNPDSESPQILLRLGIHVFGNSGLARGFADPESGKWTQVNAYGEWDMKFQKTYAELLFALIDAKKVSNTRLPTFFKRE